MRTLTICALKSVTCAFHDKTISWNAQNMQTGMEMASLHFRADVFCISRHFSTLAAINTRESVTGHNVTCAVTCACWAHLPNSDVLLCCDGWSCSSLWCSGSNSCSNMHGWVSFWADCKLFGVMKCAELIWRFPTLRVKCLEIILPCPL